MGKVEDGEPTSLAEGHREEARKIRDEVWLNQAVHKLIKAGHSLADVREYTLDQFLIFLDAVEQLDAAGRANFTSDMVSVIGGVLGSGKALTAHLESLSRLATGEHDERERRK